MAIAPKDIAHAESTMSDGSPGCSLPDPGTGGAVDPGGAAWINGITRLPVSCGATEAVGAPDAICADPDRIGETTTSAQGSDTGVIVPPKAIEAETSRSSVFQWRSFTVASAAGTANISAENFECVSQICGNSDTAGDRPESGPMHSENSAWRATGSGVMNVGLVICGRDWISPCDSAGDASFRQNGWGMPGPAGSSHGSAAASGMSITTANAFGALQTAPLGAWEAAAALAVGN